ncbi:MAG: hypothetical protein RMX96_34460, partial [Nostoc sp. ChiSLP02]|nr:hypothetical protein [Nostoc sp. ChiSLP02]
STPTHPLSLEIFFTNQLLLPKFQEIDLNNTENLENLCAYHLSSIILKAKQWVYKNNADLVKNQKINWSANIGVPIKYVDSPAIERFQKVLCLAWLLSQSDEPLPLYFQELQERIRQLRQNIYYEQIPCFAIPEIAAGVYSYTVSRQAEPGLYIFFDIGSGTIEGASFQFWRDSNKMPKVDFYSGEVEALGVNALAKWINNQVSGSKVQIEDDITYNSHKILQEIQAISESLANSHSIKQGDFIAYKFKITERAIEKTLQSNVSHQTQKLLHLILGQSSIHSQVAKVIMTSKKKNREYFQHSSSLTIFLGGGGRESQYYQDTIEATYSACNHRYADIPPYKMKELPFPESDLDMSGIERRYFHRFAIAYGLSIEEGGAPEVRLPSRFPHQPPPPVKPITPEIGRYPDDNSSM